MFAITYVEIDVPSFVDPFTLAKALLHCDGTDGATTITDSSANPKTWTAAGNAQIDTAQSKFGGASLLLDGTGDWLTTPDSADFALGSGDWTLDCWFRVNAAGGAALRLCGQTDASPTAADSAFFIERTAGNVISAQVSNGTSFVTLTGTTQFTNAVNTGWHHVALVRIANVLKLFVDGVQEGGDAAFTGSVPNSTAGFGIGIRGAAATATPWNGWIDEFRLSAGIALWREGFTPPTQAAAADQEIVTFRFAMPTDYLPPEIDCIPSITNVNFTPARVSLGKDLGQRADIGVTFTDHRHIFAGEPYSQGSFWGKWRGRYGTKLRGCPLRIIRGQVGQTLAEMDTRHYLIDSTSGPTPDAIYTIKAKDILKFADDDRAQAPLISNGRLAGSINSSTTAATLAPAGIGNAEYPASGYLCFGGKEVVSFTRSADTLTIARAQFGSVAQAHASGDRAQLVLRYSGDDPAVIIRDLLVNYAGVDSSYIDLAEWQAETAAHLGVIYAATITEPTSVKTLLSEIIEQAALALWWDDRAERVRLAVLREIPTDNESFTEERIIANSLQVQEQPLKRVSQIWTFYGQRDPTDRGADQDNFRAALADVDLVGQDEYGSAEIAQVKARWIETGTAASRHNAIKLSRFRDPPRMFKFHLVTGEQIALAAGYTLAWWANQNSLGEPILAKIQITQISIYSDRIEVEAEEMLATGELPALLNVVFLTTTGSLLNWTVPADWNDADNSVETIGGGAGGGSSGTHGGRGGGGGAYSRQTNIDLTPGGSVSYRIGAGGLGNAGATGADGGDTWFNGANLAASSVGAKGGQGGSGQTGGGLGGQASAGIGAFKTSGGDGGTGSPKGDTRAGGGAGGGAGGPNGNGGNGGGSGGSGADGGAGGGGADGGFTGGTSSGSTGGNGGNNRFNFGGGNSTTPVGDEGGGGRGGDAAANGSAGGNGEQLWTQTFAPIISAGPGGGGGGAGDGATAGRGGLYGGGGGGNGGSGSSANSGEQGIIVITWREV